MGIFSGPPFIGPLTVVYRTIAYNRGVLVPRIQREMSCDCDPDFHLGYRLTWIATGVGVLLNSLSLFDRVTPFGFSATLGVAIGFGILALASLRQGFERGVDWLGHVATASFVGALVPMLPSLVWTMALSEMPFWVATVTAVAVLLVMLRMQIRRDRATRRAGWTIVWGVGLALGTGVAALLAG